MTGGKKSDSFGTVQIKNPGQLELKLPDS